MPGAGLEPARCCQRKILSLVCLPISPPGHRVYRAGGQTWFCLWQLFELLCVVVNGSCLPRHLRSCASSTNFTTRASGILSGGQTWFCLWQLFKLLCGSLTAPAYHDIHVLYDVLAIISAYDGHSTFNAISDYTQPCTAL